MVTYLTVMVKIMKLCWLVVFSSVGCLLCGLFLYVKANICNL